MIYNVTLTEAEFVQVLFSLSHHIEYKEERIQEHEEYIACGVGDQNDVDFIKDYNSEIDLIRSIYAKISRTPASN